MGHVIATHLWPRCRRREAPASHGDVQELTGTKQCSRSVYIGQRLITHFPMDREFFAVRANCRTGPVGMALGRVYYFSKTADAMVRCLGPTIHGFERVGNLAALTRSTKWAWPNARAASQRKQLLSFFTFWIVLFLYFQKCV